MSHTIYKYTFPVADDFTLSLPVGAKILKVDYQRDFPAMWVLHDTRAMSYETRKFRVYGTGHEILGVNYLTYVGTFQMHNGDFVWHVFERTDFSGTTYIEEILTEHTEHKDA